MYASQSSCAALPTAKASGIDGISGIGGGGEEEEVEEVVEVEVEVEGEEEGEVVVVEVEVEERRRAGGEVWKREKKRKTSFVIQVRCACGPHSRT